MTARVAILSGDAVVSRALEVLLQGLGYHTRLIEEFGLGQPDELLEGIHLLLAAPTLSTEYRERFLAGMRSTPATTAIPVLTLSTVSQKDLPDQTGLVLWPCRMEDLKREIEAALLTAVATEKLASRGPEFIPETLEASNRPADSLSPQPNPVNRPPSLTSE